MHVRVLVTLALVSVWPAAAAGPATLRTAPPAGMAIAAADRAALEKGTAELARELDTLRARAGSEPRLRSLLPDVEIFHKAVDWALRYDEFFRSNEVGLARTLLEHGRKRAQHLAQGDPFWLTATGLVVRGFRSRIDDSVQPYGLVVPASFAGSTNRLRLDVWLHGRDDRLTELKFLSDRLKSPGEFTPADTFVLHPYGRFCNAFKFAGETDVFEALEHAKKSYPIDDRRLGLRGFSMGGAGVWHLAAHHPGVWAAAAPGAGFAETAEYTGALKKEPKPTVWEQKLWRLYDATDYAANFHNLPVIAYSGEIDKQKQAADVMARAMKAQGLELEHILGPGVAHKYEPGARKELARKFDAIMARGRDPAPTRIVFATSVLRYHESHWLTVERLEKSWEPAWARVETGGAGSVKVAVTNIAKFSLDLGRSPLEPESAAAIAIEGQVLRSVRPGRSGSWKATVERTPQGWQVDPPPQFWPGKQAGLQGPIDDAFFDSFVVVRPTRPLEGQRGAWFEAELARFTNEWRAQFRGDLRILDAADEASVRTASVDSHLILWGDPAGNPVLARLLPVLPFRWDATELRFGAQRFEPATHVPVMIFPNPMNRSRYIVLNSGPTFFDFGAASNAQQTPKLPDYAVLDITVPRAQRLTKGVALAGFFDERWRLPEGP